jgi:2'-hydroxyisoflavone reductase
MRRALVIGGGGYIGRRLTSQLLSENWDVTSLELRPRDPPQIKFAREIQRFYGTRDDEGVLAKALACEPDVIFDLIAYRPAETKALVELSVGVLGRLVHLSTVSVYSGFPETEPATEEAAVRFEGTEQGYGPGKAGCERVLEAAGLTGFPYVIVRSAQIMGPGDPCSRQGYLVRRILNSQPILHPGPQDGRLWLLFLDDLITGLMSAATAPVLGRVFHLAQQDAPSLLEHVQALARGLGRPAPEIVTTGVDQLIEWGFRVHGFAFARTVSVPPNTKAAQEALGWRCTPHEHAVDVTIADLLGGDRTIAYATWPGRNTTQARLSGAHEWIHAAKEARVLAGLARQPGPNADTVLGWLSDDPFHARPQLVESEEWSSYISGGPSPSRSTVATVPRELVARLLRSGSTWTPSSPHRERTSAKGLPDLVAAVELDKWSKDRLWIFSSSAPPSVPFYGLTSEPQQVDIVPFARGFEMDIGPRGRLLLEMRGVEDATILAQFLRGCIERRSLQIEDLWRWARIYIAGARMWVALNIRKQYANDGGTGTQSTVQELPWRDHIVHTSWILTHSVARLLCRAGLEGSATVRMGFEASGTGVTSAQLPPTAAICWVGARTILADLGSDRVIEIAPAIAEVLCNGADACR